MIQARRSDKERVVEMLCRSFSGNPSVDFMTGKGAAREKKARHLMEYAFEVCHKSGEVLISTGGDACALISFPHQKTSSLHTLMLDLKLVFQVIGIRKLLKVLRREHQIKKRHPKSPFCYLWFIGVEPSRQGRGQGSALLAKVLDQMDRLSLPVYLETSIEKNISWYRRFGFEVFSQMELSYTLHFLERKP